MVSFRDLKKNRPSVEALVKSQETEGQNRRGIYGDLTNFWQVTQDKLGNGHAKIRFLPGNREDGVPWSMIWSYGFKGPGGWYIERSLQTINQPDPVMELNQHDWNNGNQDAARKRRRNRSYISNIIVLEDPANPENEGKVFLFRYGKKIHDKIMDKMNPSFPDETPFNPTDLWEGANFKLRVTKVDDFVNYDKSDFEGQSALSEDDEKLEAIFNQQHDLNEFNDPASPDFKTYDQLKARLDKVLKRESAKPSLRDQISLGEETAPETDDVAADVASMEESFNSGPANDPEDVEDFFKKIAGN